MFFVCARARVCVCVIASWLRHSIQNAWDCFCSADLAITPFVAVLQDDVAAFVPLLWRAGDGTWLDAQCSAAGGETLLTLAAAHAPARFTRLCGSTAACSRVHGVGIACPASCLLSTPCCTLCSCCLLLAAALLHDRLLLENKAMVTARNARRQTALHLAARRGDTGTDFKPNTSVLVCRFVLVCVCVCVCVAVCLCASV